MKAPPQGIHGLVCAGVLPTCLAPLQQLRKECVSCHPQMWQLALAMHPPSQKDYKGFDLDCLVAAHEEDVVTFGCHIPGNQKSAPVVSTAPEGSSNCIRLREFLRVLPFQLRNFFCWSGQAGVRAEQSGLGFMWDKSQAGSISNWHQACVYLGSRVVLLEGYGRSQGWAEGGHEER